MADETPDDPNGSASYGLICPFLGRDPRFAYGVEFGLLFARMNTETHIADYFCSANQEQITLLCNRLGWRIVKMEPWGDDWHLIEMEK